MKCVKVLPNTDICSKNLRKLTVALKQKWANYKNPNSNRICLKCYLKLNSSDLKYDQNYINESNVMVFETEDDECSNKANKRNFESLEIEENKIIGESSELMEMDMLNKINSILPASLSPIYKSRLDRKSHQKKKLIQLSSYLSKTLLNEEIDSKKNEYAEKAKWYDEFMVGLKDKFQKLDNNSDRIQLLTVLPSSFALEKIKNEFGTTSHIAKSAKQLQKDNGSFSKPLPKGRRPQLNSNTTESVQSFYKNDEVCMKTFPKIVLNAKKLMKLDFFMNKI